MRVELTSHKKQKKDKGLCVCNRCMRNHLPKRNICDYHKKLKWIEANPEMYTFCNLRTNARRRGKICTLTFDQFLFFLKKNPQYMKKKGRRLNSLQIDCEENHLGYTAENIRSIKMKKNLWKLHYVDFQTTDPATVNYCGF